MRFVAHPENGWYVDLPDGTRIGRVVTAADGFHTCSVDGHTGEDPGPYASRAAAATALRSRYESAAEH